MSPDALAIARDVSIVLMCFTGFVAFILLCLILWKVYGLVKLARVKVDEYSVLGVALLENVRQTAQTAGQTATTVKGSAEFISDTVVSPVVQVVSAVAGARTFVKALFK